MNFKVISLAYPPLGRHQAGACRSYDQPVKKAELNRET
jgi:hypothetical protein